MRALFQFCLLILFPSILIGQDYQNEFFKCCENNDTKCQFTVLKKWEKENPDDPELLTSYFNYHFLQSRQEVLEMSKDITSEEGLVLKDSAGQVAGFLGSRIIFDPVEFQKAMDKIDEGIEKYPDRLDMRFGKIHVLGQVEDWEGFTNEIVNTIKYSSTNDNNWTWTNNQAREGGEDFFLSALQDYQLRLYDTGNDSLLLDMRNIAKTILDYYPDHIESLSNLSITYLLMGEFDSAITPLLKAEKINPEDYVVLSNIAYGYKLKGEKQKSINYYEKVIQFGNESSKEFAKQQIAEMSK